MTSSTDSHQILACDLVIEHVNSTMLPILRSNMLFRFGLLRIDTCVFVLPRAAVPVVGMTRVSINLAPRDISPAALCANKKPC